MKRREVLTALIMLGAASAPMCATAQTKSAGGKPIQIGLLPDLWDEWRSLFRDAMLERGWREGRDYAVVLSGIPPGPKIEEATRRILDAKPDLIYTVNTAYALAAHRLNKTIPIVMLVTGFPVEAGLAN